LSDLQHAKLANHKKHACAYTIARKPSHHTCFPAGPQAGYNHTIIPTMVMTILMGIGVLASAAGMFIYHVTSTTYTRPINYHTDVLLQR
jgi:hypothetical protein